MSLLKRFFTLSKILCIVLSSSKMTYFLYSNLFVFRLERESVSSKNELFRPIVGGSRETTHAKLQCIVLPSSAGDTTQLLINSV